MPIFEVVPPRKADPGSGRVGPSLPLILSPLRNPENVWDGLPSPAAKPTQRRLEKSQALTNREVN